MRTMTEEYENYEDARATDTSGLPLATTTAGSRCFSAVVREGHKQNPQRYSCSLVIFSKKEIIQFLLS